MLNQFLSHRLALARRSGGPDGIPIDYFVYARHSDSRWEGAWLATERLIEETRDLSRELGARYAALSASTPQGILGAEEGLELLMEVYPGMRAFEWDLDGPDRRLATFCRERGIPFRALEPLFRRAQRKGGQRFHWRYDGHWNPEGNDLAGALIAEFVPELAREVPAPRSEH